MSDRVWELKSVQSDDCTDPILIDLTQNSDTEDNFGDDSDSGDGNDQAQTCATSTKKGIMTPKGQDKTSVLSAKKSSLSMSPEQKSMKEFQGIKEQAQRKKKAKKDYDDDKEDDSEDDDDCSQAVFRKFSPQLPDPAGTTSTSLQKVIPVAVVLPEKRVYFPK